MDSGWIVALTSATRRGPQRRTTFYHITILSVLPLRNSLAIQACHPGPTRTFTNAMRKPLSQANSLCMGLQVAHHLFSGHVSTLHPLELHGQIVKEVSKANYTLSSPPMRLIAHLYQRIV
jgi:hypothetical protein